MYPQARSVGSWLKHGWHVALAYDAGFLVMLALLRWHPDPAHKTATEAAPAAMQPARGAP
jgi:hypothetical protein